MDRITGVAIINKHTEFERHMTQEWEPMQQRLLAYVNSLQPILSEEEVMVATGLSDFMKTRDEALQRNRELIKDAQEFGDGVVTAEILDRKKETDRTFDQASEILAETILEHRQLTILPRDFSLETSQSLLIRFSNLQEISSEILASIENQNNHHNLRVQTNIWKINISRAWSALSDIHMLFPTYRLQQKQLDQLNVLLTRVKELHSPTWYFQFVEAVGGNAIEEIQQFRVNMEEYNLRIGELFTEIEQFLDY